MSKSINMMQGKNVKDGGFIARLKLRHKGNLSKIVLLK